MLHKYFLSKNLDDIEHFHDDLIQTGLSDDQIHVWSESEDDVFSHHIKPVNPFMKTDVVYSTFKGAVIGFILAGFIFSLPFIIAFDNSIKYVPFIFTALIALGFCTWEGGLRGIQTPNHHFKHLQDKIKKGYHLLIIDFELKNEKNVQHLLKKYPTLSMVEAQ